MKFLIRIIIVFLYANTINSQVTSIPFSNIDCNSTSTIITLSNNDAPMQYNYTVSANSCSFYYTNSFNSSFEQIPVTCPGVYSFTFTDPFNFQTYLTHTVYLSTQFTPTITSTKDTICDGENISLNFTNITSSYTINPFIWNNNSTITPIIASPSITSVYSLSGLFTTASSRTCNAISSKTISVIDCTGNPDVLTNWQMSIFPNPTSDFIYFEYEYSEIKLNNIEIKNIFGDLVFKISNPGNKISIDIISLPAGIYFLNLQANGIKKVFKILKE